NGGNGNRDNGGNGGNGNEGNGNHGMNYGGFMPIARECTFQEFLKCKPHTFLENRRHCRIDMLQPPFKRQNTTRQNVARAYTARNYERKGNQNRGNQTRNETGNKTGGNEVTARTYAIGGGGTNPDSNVVTETNIVLRGCTLGLLGHPFDIDLMPVELGSFDVIIGMDWLAKYHTLIICDEKV
nr:reverse transcriptase domain-containing protein [Tanacetum cinerariifolium]